MNHCAICRKEHDLFPLTLHTEEGEPFLLYVCGTCWDVIAGIAKLVIPEVLKGVRMHFGFEKPDAEPKG